MTYQQVDSVRKMVSRFGEALNPYSIRTFATDFFQDGKHKALKVLLPNGSDSHVQNLFETSCEQHQLIRSCFGDIALETQYITDQKYYAAVSDFVHTDNQITKLLENCFVYSEQSSEAGKIDQTGVEAFAQYLSQPGYLAPFQFFLEQSQIMMQKFDLVLDRNSKDNLSFDRSGKLVYLDSFRPLHPADEVNEVELQVMQIIADGTDRGGFSVLQKRVLQGLQRPQGLMERFRVEFTDSRLISLIIYLLEQKHRIKQSCRKNLSLVLPGYF